MLTQNYNPDVLSCLANLSSDEVFPPPSLASQVAFGEGVLPAPPPLLKTTVSPLRNGSFDRRAPSNNPAIGLYFNSVITHTEAAR